MNIMLYGITYRDVETLPRDELARLVRLAEQSIKDYKFQFLDFQFEKRRSSIVAIHHEQLVTTRDYLRALLEQKTQ